MIGHNGSLSTPRASHDDRMPTARTTGTDGMPSIPPMVLAAWEVGATTVEAIDTGQNSMHWRARTRGRPLALRRYGRDTTPADIDREFDVLGVLAAHGVGVPVVAPTISGEAAISVGGDLWVAFEWIEGRPPARSDLEVARRVGLALALAHEAPMPTSLASTPRLRDFADAVRWDGLTCDRPCWRCGGSTSEQLKR